MTDKRGMEYEAMQSVLGAIGNAARPQKARDPAETIAHGSRSVAILRRAVFAGCARNCGSALPGVLRNLERIGGMFSEASYLFVENDSTDDTKQVLAAWCRERRSARVICLDGLAACCPVRTLRLEIARNQYLSTVRNQFTHCDYMFVLDCDDLNAGDIDLGGVAQAVRFLESDPAHAAAFANQHGDYYDIWAFRHPERCPGDVWEELFDYKLAHKVSDEEAFQRTFAKRLFWIPRTEPPLEVDSAFGGLGIYKIRSVLKNRRAYVGSKKKVIASAGGTQEIGWETCEHVSFHAGFREQGDRLFVLPFLINCAGSWNFSPSFWRNCIFDPRLAGPQSPMPHHMLNRATEPAALKRNPEAGARRNDPCPCGSGRRYKHCHGRDTAPDSQRNATRAGAG